MNIAASFPLTSDTPAIANESSGQSYLENIKKEALARQEGFAGSIPPTVAWQLFQLGLVQIVDIRSAEERKFVGFVPETVAVPWASGTSLTRNPRFLKELESRAGKHGQPLLLLCRSGKRSLLAAEAATKAGFDNVFNILEGFEGDLDEQGQRGHFNGWRFAGLPWVQD